MEAKDVHTYCIRNVEDGQTSFCCLTLDEKVICTSQHSLSLKSKATSGGDDCNIAVPLMLLTVWKTAGVTVSPASRDLKCKLNGEDIEAEAHFIPGSHIEVGDKVFELLDGALSKHQRRHLPPTPGVPILPTPPPKPQRVSVALAGSNEGSGRDVLREWCLIQLPNSEHELLQQTKDPVQLANLASSYLTRHILLHTDVVLSAELTDSIFKMMQDPRYLVLLCLQLLRALSHVPGNVITMVGSNTPAAVLGSMAAYKDDDKIQNNCLDILAKLATFLPSVLEKPPLRESSIDLVAMALTLHVKNMTVVQAGIRTLANLASSLHLLAFASMRVGLFSSFSLFVQNALGSFCNDLTVKTDGRRFLFEYAKMDQLKSQHKLWSLASDSLLRKAKNTLENCKGSISENDEECDNTESDGNETSGILKKSRSFENLRNPNRRVSFVNEDDVPSSPTSSSSGASSPTSSPGDSELGSSPDIQVLSHSRIYPVAVGTESTNVLSSSEEIRISSGTTVAAEHLNSHSQGHIIADVTLVQESNNENNVSLSESRLSSDDLQNNTKSESSKADENSGHLSVFHRPRSFIPVDLTNFRYSAADVIYMKRLMSLQVTCHVCSASVQGSDPPALRLIDMPLSQLLSRPGIPNALWQFADSQFEEKASLMDVDPGTVISIIDAVRYKMLMFDLVKKSLLMLIDNFSPKVHTRMFEVTREVIESVLADAALQALTTDVEFVTSLVQQLENVRQAFHDPHPVASLAESIKLLLVSKERPQENQQN
ncbi:unnamed protein product [Candidula unifasciata]|uniref:Uncharacterized protein n=1 Tax=Candidula unifasciata TaxID=100452 RepID=A0A8S3YLQ2_9EUPU|nr:unnamed protein product [Candidula unifasciata]